MSEPPTEVKAVRQDVTVAPRGDIILCFEDETYIRVSSVVLSCFSPVFETMLGPSFKEGSEPGTALHPTEVDLPEDDAQAMKHLCYLLHGQRTESDGAPDEEFVRRLWELAIVADK